MTTDFLLVRHHNSARMLMSRRWIALSVISLLLHVWAINWANGNIRLPSLHDKNDVAVTAVLIPAPPMPVAVPAPQLKTKSLPRPVPPASPVLTAPVEIAPIQADAGIEMPVEMPDNALQSESEAEAALPAPESVGKMGQPGSPDQAAGEPQEPAGAQYKVSPPPSVELKYDVTKVPKVGNPTYGHGSITWQSTGNNYVINGEAGILFITALTFKSEGMIDGFGVAPLIYSEKRIRKSETNTHFHRERNTISFSASTTSYPRQGGEQDRASIVWQLAGIGRGDSKKFAPDASIDIFVAGVRDGEAWRIHVIGQEEIEVAAGKMSTWHVVRVPKPGSYDQKLDIWLAPQHEWYPVKLRYTEANGDYIDMSLSDMRVAAMH
jgi:hypothetical protein